MNKDDPRYGSDEASKDMRIVLSSLEKCTHKFIREHSELSTKVEFLKYKNYLEQRENIRSHQTDPRYQTSSVRRELNETLSSLQKTTHNFVRHHNELANKAEYLKYADFVRQCEKNSKSHK